MGHPLQKQAVIAWLTSELMSDRLFHEALLNTNHRLRRDGSSPFHRDGAGARSTTDTVAGVGFYETAIFLACGVAGARGHGLESGFRPRLGPAHRRAHFFGF